MRNLPLLFLIAFMAISSACRKDPQSAAGDGARIRFDQIEKGQRSRYLLLQGKHFYDDQINDFEYLPDTLVLSVVDQDDRGWLIEEKLTPGSASLHGKENIHVPDSVFYYYFNIENDSLLITPGPHRSWVYSRFFNYSTPLPLAPVKSPEANIEGWKIKAACEAFCTAYDADYSLFGVHYGRLNLYSDARPTFVDGPGVFYAYSSSAGIVKSIRFGGWSVKGLGWDLLPN